MNRKPNYIPSHNPHCVSEEYEFGDCKYGKNNVKVLHVQRQGNYHTIKEYEVNVILKLNSKKDYLQGDNSDIVATDSQKNTVYILAKKYGLTTPEDFGLIVCNHFLYTYAHVTEVNVKVDDYPWGRMENNGRPHNHAFVFTPIANRFAIVSQKRNAPPKITAGLLNLRVLKTTKSSFVGFVDDAYRTLPDQKDRILSTIVESTWDYSRFEGMDFDSAWTNVKDFILDRFAGDPEVGIASPSVQNTLYLASKMALDRIPQISRISMVMPNRHYFSYDLSPFTKLIGNDDYKEVYLPVDKPSGSIHSELYRKDFHSKL